MKSMTGYGKGEISLESKTLTVELKSVNHRFLDVSIKMPSCLNAFEDYVRKVLQSKFTRGHFDCYINFNVSGVGGVLKEYTVNMQQVKEYLDLSSDLAKTFGLKELTSVNELFKLPSVLVEKQAENDQDLLKSLLAVALEDATNALIEMRAKEGEALKSVVSNHLNVIEGFTASVKSIAPEVVSAYREKLRARVQDYLKEVPIDEARLLNEVAVFSDKVNVDEEINRMLSHIEQFRTLINDDLPCGKKLDFLIQEMNREANTMGSKANNSSILKFVVDLKNEIEKLREQIQNIE